MAVETSQPYETLLLDVRRRARLSQHGHHLSARSLSRQARQLGGVAAVLATIVGAGSFATIGVDEDWVKIASGTLALISAGFAAYVSYVRLGERAESHAQAAPKYAALRSAAELEITRLRAGFRQDDEQSSSDSIDALTSQILESQKSLATTSPQIPRSVYSRVEKLPDRGIEPREV